MAVRLPEKGVPKEPLAHLAKFLLCKRWHRQPGHSQISSVRSTWQSNIESFCSRREQFSVARSQTQTRSLMRPSQSNERSQRARRHVPASRVVSLLDSAARPTRESGRQSEQYNSVAAGLTRVTVSSSENQDSPETSDIASDEDLSAASSDEADASTMSSLLDEEEQEITPLQPPQSRINLSSTVETHVAETAGSRPQRRPLIEPCCVCMETLESEQDAVWCRAQCGQNIHRSCFEEWRDQRLGTYDNHPDRRNEVLDVRVHKRLRMKSVRCVFCRSAWKWEWED